MNIMTHLRHISHNDDLQMQIERLWKAWTTPEQARDLKVEVFVSQTAPRAETGEPTFECHMTARAPWLKGPKFARAVDADYWSAFTSCTARLRHVLEKRRIWTEGGKLCGR